MRSKRKSDGMTPFAAGSIGLVILFLALYAAFVHKYPWSNPYELRAVFENAANIQPKSPVRISGVVVGTVKKLETKPGSTASVVVMELTDEALPIHRDATLKIRPRIFLEGNFFVDLKPGSAGSPVVDSEGQIPMSQTAAPVQFDQILSSLQADQRQSLQKLLQGYGTALNGKPEPGEDDDQDTVTKGETAGESLNDSLEYAPDALRGLAEVNDATLGTELHDLSQLVASGQKVSAELADHEESLQNLVSSFNTTVTAFADQSSALRTSISVLPDVLENADRALLHLNESFPPVRAFAREILPGVRETPETVAASFPWIEQTRKLVSPAELQGLARDLSPATRDLATVTDQSLLLFPEVDLVSRCMTQVILPTGDIKLDDGPLTTGVENYKEFWQTMTSLSSESQNFDGNGQYTRFQPGGGDQQVSTGQVRGATGSNLFANATMEPIGTRPKMPARRPPYKRDEPCYTQTIPDLNSAQIGAGP